MKQSTKVSLKQSKIEIKKSVISFTAMQSKKVDDVISVIETLIDMNEGFTKDKAQRNFFVYFHPFQLQKNYRFQNQ